MAKVSAWCSVLELRDLLASVFYRGVKSEGGSNLAVAVVLVASVTDSHGRELPNAPVNVVFKWVIHELFIFINVLP